MLQILFNNRRRAPRTLLVFLLIALLCAGSAAGVGRVRHSAVANDTPATQLPLADDPSGTKSGVPDYELQTLKGGVLRLSSLRGRTVLLDFFLAACPHCRAHAPFIADLAKRYKERGLVVVGLCTNNPFTEHELVQDYVKSSGLEAEVAFVPLEVLMSYLAKAPDGTYGVPQAVLFGTDGRVVARFLQWQEKDLPAIEQAIEKELNQKKQ